MIMQTDYTPTPNQRRILEALYEEGGLSTPLLAQYVLADLSPSQLNRELMQLQMLGLVRGQPVQHCLCWVLSYDGTRTLGHTPIHGEARYRFATISQLAARTLTLQLTMTLRSMGWAWVRPLSYNPGHPKPDDTPQYQAVYRAVEYHFRHAPADPDDADTLSAPLLHPSHVPAGLNDWVAWPRNLPHKAVVLIVHPLGGTRKFWTTYDHARKKRNPAKAIASRVQSYQPIAQILPVIGVFATEDQVHDFTPLLEAAHFQAYTVQDLAAFLYKHATR